MDFRRALILAVMDILLLSELTFAIWYAHFEMEVVAWRFLQVFLPPVILTILGTRWAFKRWAPKVKVTVEESANQPWRPVNLFGVLGQNPNPPRRDS
ncbi:MAG: hypothetical protein KJ720_13605 [Proteobacteria bacterium]|nr:hypothetical protein [Pseudomonadota bacterium]MBU1449843.1 hypothetical protein [Pseudomonadota bacterium]MBU2467983.1 hypothetical protein [Pseudomonadota bacterium]MBU2516617.1 hypothetical protein [Pseudomonadota bacterium]